MKKLLAVLMVLALAGPVSAATVSFWIDADSGSFDVYCQITDYDATIEGLASVYAEVSHVTTCTNLLPKVQVVIPPYVDAPKAGFTLFRSADNDPAFTAGQDTLNSAGHTVIKYFGMQQVDMTASFSGPFVFTPSSGTAANPLLVGSGTYSGAAPTLVLVSATVLDNDAPPSYVSDADSVIVPDPITIGLLGFGAMGLLLRRRR
jgi:hypothetical protein